MRTKMMIMRTMRMIILIMMIIMIKTKNGGDQVATVEVDQLMMMIMRTMIMIIRTLMMIMRTMRMLITIPNSCRSVIFSKLYIIKKSKFGPIRLGHFER